MRHLGYFLVEAPWLNTGVIRLDVWNDADVLRATTKQLIETLRYTPAGVTAKVQFISSPQPPKEKKK